MSLPAFPTSRRLNRLQSYCSAARGQFDAEPVHWERPDEFSHAIRKDPLLKQKEGPTTESFAKETITARVPDAAELREGAQALQAAPFDTPLYAGWI
jgi:hypothetical protein